MIIGGIEIGSPYRQRDSVFPIPIAEHYFLECRLVA